MPTDKQLAVIEEAYLCTTCGESKPKGGFSSTKLERFRRGETDLLPCFVCIAERDSARLAATVARRKAERKAEKAAVAAEKRRIDGTVGRKARLERLKNSDDPKDVDARMRAKIAQTERAKRAWGEEKIARQKLAKERRVAKALDQNRLIQRELARRTLCKRQLLPFVLRFKRDYEAGWVHHEICSALEQFAQDVEDKKSPRLMLFVPPRHGKSELASVNFPAWYLGRNPTHEIISCSYASSLAMSFSRRVRELLRDPSYGTVFGDAKLSKDSQATDAWMTTKGGGYLAAGVGGPITGRGAHVLIIDDPVKNRDEADSEVARNTVKNWYTSTAYTRLAPGGGVLIILTRWHDDDLAGWQLSEGGDDFKVISFPALATEDEEFRTQGEALHPARYDVAALERIKNTVGPRDWAALYQQNPVPDDGSYFTKDMLREYETLPATTLEYYCIWDLAIGQKETNDYTVGMTFAWDVHHGVAYAVDFFRKRCDATEIVSGICDMYERQPVRPAVVGIERGHIQMTMGPLLEQEKSRRSLHSMFVRDLPPGRKDKRARARTVQGMMQQGRVKIPAGAAWADDVRAELLRFDTGKHDDIVDVFAWFGIVISEFGGRVTEEGPKQPLFSSWKDRLRNLGRKASKGYLTA